MSDFRPASDIPRPSPTWRFVRPRPVWHHVVLFLATLGLYRLFWMYWTWRHLRERHRLDVIPLARALLWPFFLFSLLHHLFRLAGERGYPERPPAVLLATAHIALAITGNLPGPVGLSGLLGVLPLLPAFETASFLVRHDAPDLPEQRGLAPLELLIVALGIPLVGLATYLVLTLPPEALAVR